MAERSAATRMGTEIDEERGDENVPEIMIIYLSRWIVFPQSGLRK